LFPTEPPGDPPTITGVLTEIVTGPDQRVYMEGFGGPLATILVEEDPELSFWEGIKILSPKRYFWIGPETNILVERLDGGWRQGDVTDLVVGRIVSGWHKKGNGVLESYPSQGPAGTVSVYLDGL
jgi:hypothetical protein